MKAVVVSCSCSIIQLLVYHSVIMLLIAENQLIQLYLQWYLWWNRQRTYWKCFHFSTTNCFAPNSGGFHFQACVPHSVKSDNHLLSYWDIIIIGYKRTERHTDSCAIQDSLCTFLPKAGTELALHFDGNTFTKGS